MKKINKIIAIMVAITMMSVCIGCKEETPAEKAAKKVDKAIEKTKELFE